MAHNRQWNRPDVTQYNLAGFVFCKRCGKALGGRMDYGKTLKYYTHHSPGCGCGFRGVRGERLEGTVLDALYTFFLDEPRFTKALQAAMPTGERRGAPRRATTSCHSADWRRSNVRYPVWWICDRRRRTS